MDILKLVQDLVSRDHFPRPSEQHNPLTFARDRGAKILTETNAVVIYLLSC